MKRTFAIGALLLSLLALSACGIVPRIASQTSAPPPHIELRTSSPFGGSDPHGEIYNAILAEFMAQNEAISIKDISTVSDETWKQNIVNDFNADNDPDVLFFFAGIEARPFIDNDKIVDIETIRARYPDYAANIAVDCLRNVTYSDGRVYAVPINRYYEGLFCNEALFARCGVELPRTWEQLLEAGDAFNALGIVPIAVALGHIPHYIVDQLILSSAGIEEHRALPRTVAELPDSWVRGVDMIRELYLRGMFPENTNNTWDEETKQLFLDGKAAMIVDGSWLVGQIDRTSDDPDRLLQRDVRVIPFPRIPGGNANGTEVISGTSMGFMITRKAWDDPAKRDACVRLVMAMTSDDAIARFTGPGIGGLPASDAVRHEVEPGTVDPTPLLSGARGTDAPCLDRFTDEARSALLLAIPEIATGERNAREVLETMIEKNAASVR